jgi:magnesium chelatase family protein
MNNIHYNAQMNTKHIREYCALDETSKQLLKTAMERLNLSARAYDRILKVARTIDLDAAPGGFSSHCRGDTIS